MRNRTIMLFLIAFFSVNMTSCTLFKNPIDNKSGFSDYLEQTEASIRTDDWHNANSSLKNSKKIWKNMKPWLQLDIDHDYIKDIENNFTKLEAYIYTEEKPDSLATILLIMDTWENINIY